MFEMLPAEICNTPSMCYRINWVVNSIPISRTHSRPLNISERASVRILKFMTYSIHLLSFLFCQLGFPNLLIKKRRSKCSVYALVIGVVLERPQMASRITSMEGETIYTELQFYASNVIFCPVSMNMCNS